MRCKYQIGQRLYFYTPRYPSITNSKGQGIGIVEGLPTEDWPWYRFVLDNFDHMGPNRDVEEKDLFVDLPNKMQRDVDLENFFNSIERQGS
jgi:hypothetical protein